eukprot:757762-Lingulodinium_polyedra.AAC.1
MQPNCGRAPPRARSLATRNQEKKQRCRLRARASVTNALLTRGAAPTYTDALSAKQRGGALRYAPRQ